MEGAALMGLAARIVDEGESLAGRRGCASCAWYATLDKEDKQAFDTWVAAGKSTRGLWKMCSAEGLNISCSPFRDHVANHHGIRE